MMQLDELILYPGPGNPRSVAFDAGELNIITGDSETGKSSIINILRYLLGADSLDVPRGPIRSRVKWYGLRAHVRSTEFFIGRPAVSPNAKTTTAAMLRARGGPAPSWEELSANTTGAEVREYLGGLLGFEDNLHVPPDGQTRRPLAANFVHTLYYCFQGQGEIANPDILFHRQNKDPWQAQTIKDTLPYFLGAQGAEELRKREQLDLLKRKLRRAATKLSRIESELDSGARGVTELVAQAQAVNLLPRDYQIVDFESSCAALASVRDASDTFGLMTTAAADHQGMMERRRELLSEFRENSIQLQHLDEFAHAGERYGGELIEQQARLASLELIRTETTSASCVVCGQDLEGTQEDISRDIQSSLGWVARRLATAQRERPRIQGARSGLLRRREELSEELRTVTATIRALAEQDELVARAADAVNAQSYVRGRIAQYLELIESHDGEGLQVLRDEVAQLQSEVEELSERLDFAGVRSRTISLLQVVNRPLTSYAQRLRLEHSEISVRIDPDRLTIVADTADGPAYMDQGEIGSGKNWVGYHLSAYLAMHSFFVDRERPVPAFIVFDQPSQAFFPRDRERGGDLDELSDTDRETTRELYRLMYDVVRELRGDLQIIALDHADFEDEPWFRNSVRQRWREGKKLIPAEWYESTPPA